MEIKQKFDNLVDPKTIAFNKFPNAYSFIVKSSKLHEFVGIKNKEEKSILVYFKDYTFKKNDQLIDKTNTSFFVKEIETNFSMPINVQHYFSGFKEEAIIVQKIMYDEKPAPIPNYMKQISQITNTINIDAKDSNINNVGNILVQQNFTYQQLYDDLNNIVENSFNIKQLREMMQDIKESLQQKKEIKESKIKKFFQFLGTQGLDLAKAFLAAYAATLANKA